MSPRRLNQKLVNDYKAVGRSGTYWLAQAEAFLEAAKSFGQLRFGNITPPPNETNENIRLFFSAQTYYFLRGLALENLLKGLIIVAEPNYVTDLGLNDDIKTHKLADLAKTVKKLEACDLDFDTPTLEFLKRLADFVWWQGRYPIPLKPEHRKESEFKGQDKAIFDSLWKRLSSTLREASDKQENKTT
jgi:hypothetical protein